MRTFSCKNGRCPSKRVISATTGASVPVMTWIWPPDSNPSRDKSKSLCLARSAWTRCSDSTATISARRSPRHDEGRIGTDEWFLLVQAVFCLQYSLQSVNWITSDELVMSFGLIAALNASSPQIEQSVGEWFYIARATKRSLVTCLV